MLDMAVKEKMEYFRAVMQVLHQYEIMPARSPVLVFTEASRESDRVHLLALREICKMCLEMVERHFKNLKSVEVSTQIKEINHSAKEDAFEAHLISANWTELGVLEGRLLGCVARLNRLILQT
jgi:hypothetical protein